MASGIGRQPLMVVVVRLLLRDLLLHWVFVASWAPCGGRIFIGAWLTWHAGGAHRGGGSGSIQLIGTTKGHVRLTMGQRATDFGPSVRI